VTKNVTLSVLRQCRRGGLPSPSPGRESKLAESFIDRLSIKTPSGATPVATLSGGNQQKVLMARWLATEAKVFLLDEPTVGIDVEAKEELYKLIRELADGGAAMVVVCSDFAELAAVCDRVYVLNTDGQIVGEAEGDDVNEGHIVHLCFGEEAP
jgi:ABC-type sugar transport system ATPase subunit